MATIHPDEQFDAEFSADELRKAMKGFGTDEARIIRTLTSVNNDQRQEIKLQFKQKYGKDVEKKLKSELGGDLEEVVMALMDTPRTYDAKELHRAIKGAGTEESTLIEIMCTRSNDEIAQIKDIYKEEFGSELEDDISSDTGGYLRRILVSQSTGARNEDESVDEDLATEDARAIYDAGEGQLGTDEAAISGILCTRSWAQLRATFDAYRNIAEKDIEDAMKSETSGAVEEAYLTVVKYAKDPIAFFAERLHDSLEGVGTKDSQLIRVIVSRSEIDLQYIRDKYEEMYGKSLKSAIEGDCGGDYKRMLLSIIA